MLTIEQENKIKQGYSKHPTDVEIIDFDNLQAGTFIRYNMPTELQFCEANRHYEDVITDEAQAAWVQYHAIWWEGDIALVRKAV